MLTNEDIQAIDKLLSKRLKPIREDVQDLKSNVRVMKSDISKIRKSQDKMDNFLDREHMHTARRVDRIENHLDLQPLPRPEFRKV